MPSFPRHKLLSLFIICLIICLAAFSWSGQVLALDVNEIRFGQHPNKTRMVLDLSESTNFRVFVLSDPYRMVIDLPDFNWQVGTVYKPDSAGISSVRQGKVEPGISRIVFDMDGPVSVSAAFSLPGETGKPDRLVVDFNAVNSAASKSRVYGTLTGGSLPIPAQTYKTAAPGTVTPPPAKPDRKKPSYKKPLIVIDPGHGGNDPGAIGKRKTREKDVVLSLAKELKKQLEASGQFDVILTRKNDKYIRLRDRVKLARKHRADLFVSLHADSIEKSSVRGSSIYTLSEKASDAQTAKLAAKENRSDLIAGLDLSHEDKDVANILVDLAMRDTMNQSNFFANKLVDKLKAQSGVRTLPNPHRYAGFAVLKAPDIPSVLIEAGFMSNREEERLLGRNDHRRKVASAIRYGITAYFEHVRKNERS